MRKIYYFFLFTEKTNEQPPKDFHFCDIEDIIEKKKKEGFVGLKRKKEMEMKDGITTIRSEWVCQNRLSFSLW